MDAFGVCGAADEVADFGPEAGRRGGRFLSVVVAARAEGENTLEWLLGPQETALVDGQGTRVVQNDSSVLTPTGKKTTKICSKCNQMEEQPFKFFGTQHQHQHHL